MTKSHNKTSVTVMSKLLLLACFAISANAFSTSYSRSNALNQVRLHGSYKSINRNDMQMVFGKSAAVAATTAATSSSNSATCSSLCGVTSWLKSSFQVAALSATTSKLFVPIVIAFVSFCLLYIQRNLWIPTRTYNKEANSVGREYDSWTSEGILEYYWGEHIHLGYYNDEEREKGYKKKNFIGAKYDFIDRMAEFGQVNNLVPAKVLDVGCGIGGTSRYLAKKFGTETSVTGITLSPQQVKRAQELASDRKISNVNFQVMDALKMDFPDDTFDVVWACESGEHMPDKKKYVEEMTRVLKPGGRIVIATWCQRDENGIPFNAKDRKMLDFLYSEWTHPFFISISDYAKLMFNTKRLRSIITADWAKETIPSWRHSIWVGVYDPWPVVRRPHLWYKTFRDGITLERMHQAFTDGLMQYGMMTAVKC